MMNPDAKNCRNITKYIFEISVHFNNKINIKIRVESPRILIPAIIPEIWLELSLYLFPKSKFVLCDIGSK